jgi:omega-amidase
VYFPLYAEHIGFKQGERYDVEASESESVRTLSEAAKAEGVWLLGGPYKDLFPFSAPYIMHFIGSIPERDPSDGKIYNTLTAYSPEGAMNPPFLLF